MPNYTTNDIINYWNQQWGPKSDNFTYNIFTTDGTNYGPLELYKNEEGHIVSAVLSELEYIKPPSKIAWKSETNSKNRLIFKTTVEGLTSKIHCAVKSRISTVGKNPFFTLLYSYSDNKPDPNCLETANTYRTKLLQTDNGKQLISTYDKNNQALNIICNEYDPSDPLNPKKNNTFTYNWVTCKKYNNKDTTFFANQTNRSALNPTDPKHTVGDDDYRKHAFYLQGLLLSVANDKSKKLSGDSGNIFSALAKDTSCFYDTVQDPSLQGPMTTQAVMDKVSDSTQQSCQGPKTTQAVMNKVNAKKEDRIVFDSPDPAAIQAQKDVEKEIKRWEEKYGSLSPTSSDKTSTVNEEKLIATSLLKESALSLNIEVTLDVDAINNGRKFEALQIKTTTKGFTFCFEDDKDKNLQSIKPYIEGSHYFRQLLEIQFESVIAKNLRKYIADSFEKHFSLSL